MKVTNVSLRATEAAKEAGRPELTPELLAATGARYSRSNEGLESILSKIDPNNSDKSVDAIFKFIDYGHASIADAVPVAIFLDEISIFVAYLLWSWCPTAGGQESSTRYIKLSPEGLVDPCLFGLMPDQYESWYQAMVKCFDAYNVAVGFWEQQVVENPSLARIPTALLGDTSDKAQKQVARMKRNYAFDRSRYFLPVAALTNQMMIMSARGWVQLCQNLLSHWLPECVALGINILKELALSAPRMVKHATAKASFVDGLLADFHNLSDSTSEAECGEAPCVAKISLCTPGPEVDDVSLARSLDFHDNRYAYIGSDACRTSVRFSWSAVSMAEIRDFNRHRTGQKYCPLRPVGFYAAEDQVPDGKYIDPRLGLKALGDEMMAEATTRLRHRNPSYVAHLLLGHQFMFEHTTTLDKFVYEAELRTGTGAHYRYATHIRDAVAELSKTYPKLAQAVKLGTSEPE